MKKMTSAVLVLSLALATAGISLAAQSNPASGNASAIPAKKHVKKHKKAVKGATATSATPTTK